MQHGARTAQYRISELRSSSTIPVLVQLLRSCGSYACFCCPELRFAYSGLSLINRLRRFATLSPFTFRLSPFAFHLSPFSFHLSPFAFSPIAVGDEPVITPCATRGRNDNPDKSELRSSSTILPKPPLIHIYPLFLKKSPYFIPKALLFVMLLLVFDVTN